MNSAARATAHGAIDAISAPLDAEAATQLVLSVLRAELGHEPTREDVERAAIGQYRLFVALAEHAQSLPAEGRAQALFRELIGLALLHPPFFTAKPKQKG